MRWVDSNESFKSPCTSCWQEGNRRGHGNSQRYFGRKVASDWNSWCSSSISGVPGRWCGQHGHSKGLVKQSCHVNWEDLFHPRLTRASADPSSSYCNWSCARVHPKPISKSSWQCTILPFLLLPGYVPHFCTCRALTHGEVVLAHYIPLQAQDTIRYL